MFCYMAKNIRSVSGPMLIKDIFANILHTNTECWGSDRKYSKDLVEQKKGVDTLFLRPAHLYCCWFFASFWAKLVLKCFRIDCKRHKIEPYNLWPDKSKCWNYAALQNDRGKFFQRSLKITGLILILGCVLSTVCIFIAQPCRWLCHLS